MFHGIHLMIGRKYPVFSKIIGAALMATTALQGCAVPSLGGGNDQTASSPTQEATVLSSTIDELKVNPNAVIDYLTNPGIGWQDGPEPYGIMNFPETVDYGNRREIAWSELNPSKGVYDWSALDTQLDNTIRAGEQFSFRVYTHVGEGYDGYKIPEWVLAEGARLLPTGEPDYSNCVYQEEWGTFVNELRRVYDGNPNIAFIDISGYGNFNEWSWQDSQTAWDNQWDVDYSNGTASAGSFQTLDGQARRRLADIFIGGSFKGHACRTKDGTNALVDYSYPGFQLTQLIMPYAGIVQSTQYVFSRQKNAGIRYDCLGRDGQHVFEKIGNEIRQTWANAPVIFELCKPGEMDLEDARWLLQAAHGSLVHNNNWTGSWSDLEKMMLPVGYRYMLNEMHYRKQERQIVVEMKWQNLGLAPSYPKMGEAFQLYLCLENASGKIVLMDPVQTEISKWLPADASLGGQPTYTISFTSQYPAELPAGSYWVGVMIVDQRTNTPIRLAIEGRDPNGVYQLFMTKIEQQ
jgi:hypothetical protein